METVLRMTNLFEEFILKIISSQFNASCIRRWKKRGRLPIGDN